MASPSEWELIFGDEPSDQARMLSDMLRRRQAVGQIAGLVGGRSFAPWGHQMSQQAQGDLDRLAKVGVARQGALTREREALIQAASRGQSGPPEQRPQYRIVVGPDGMQYRVDLGNPTAPPIPLGVEKPIRGGLPANTKVQVANQLREYEALKGLGKSFRDEFAGGGPLGKMATTAYQKVGSWGSQGMQDDAQWWANFDKFVNLPERNRLFGQTLTHYEQQSWNQAQYLNPRTDPKRVREQIDRMLGVYEAWLGRQRESLVADKYDPQAVDALFTGEAPKPSGGPGSEGRPKRAVYNPKTKKVEWVE